MMINILSVVLWIAMLFFVGFATYESQAHFVTNMLLMILGAGLVVSGVIFLVTVAGITGFQAILAIVIAAMLLFTAGVYVSDLVLQAQAAQEVEIEDEGKDSKE